MGGYGDQSWLLPLLLIVNGEVPGAVSTQVCVAPAVSAAASEALSAARGAFQGCAAGRGSGQSPHWTHCPFCAACEPDAGSSLPFLSSLVPRLSPECPPLSGVLTAGLSVWLVLPVDLWFLEEWAGVHSRLVTSPWPPQVTLPSLDPPASAATSSLDVPLPS